MECTALEGTEGAATLEGTYAAASQVDLAATSQATAVRSCQACVAITIGHNLAVTASLVADTFTVEDNLAVASWVVASCVVAASLGSIASYLAFATTNLQPINAFVVTLLAAASFVMVVYKLELELRLRLPSFELT